MSNAYLVVYNTTLCGGWAYCLYLTLYNILSSGTISDFWQIIEMPLKIFQTSALLEIIHSTTGLVKSPIMVTAMQVASRIWIVWGIINPVQESTTTSGIRLFTISNVDIELSLISLVLSWSLAEIIRYGFYALKELGIDLYLFKWLRYSGFVILYPIGVSSELAIIYLALPVINATKLWSFDMPNHLNFAFSFYYACLLQAALYLPCIEVYVLKWLRYTIFIFLYPVGVGSELSLVYLALPFLKASELWSIEMPNYYNFAFSYYIYVITYSLLYIPFFPQLYLYMFKQRAKVLGGAKSKNKTE